MWRWAALAGIGCVATGLLPFGDAAAVTVRVAPVLLFLAGITVVAELADGAEVFDLAAVEAARLGGGRTYRLYALVLLLGVATTVLLSLDTTAVLLTPVVLSLTVQLELSPLPFAMATVWLANTASLLLPVSNLTNLLAYDRLGLTFGAFAGRMWAPALAAVLVTCLLLVVRYRRALRGSYVVPRRRRPADPLLFWACTGVCLLVVPTFALGLPVWAVSCAAAVVLVALYAVRRPKLLRLSLVPWRLVLLVEGLFLVVATCDRFGLHRLLARAAGPGDGPLAALRTAAVTGGLANLVNNLPAYYAMEGGDQTHVLAVLLGANVGPLVLLWGSLATLLWRERCRARGLEVSAREFATVGVVGVPLLLVATTVALLATG